LEKLSSILSLVNVIVVTIALPLLTFLGVQRFIIQPRYEARISRRKYATALYLACKELSFHLGHTLKRLESGDSNVGNAMKKIPNADFHGNPAWFTKEGYYATITAYKIAAVSAWLRIYQNELLFSSYSETQAFLNELYVSAQNLKLAFSTGTCLWYYYFDAIGERLIEAGEKGQATVTFSKFCACYSDDGKFRLFFEQAHMYIWFLGNKESKYMATIPEIKRCLQELISLLEKKNLLPGFRVERPDPAVGEIEKAHQAGWQ
jgi:hypothetical protein